jgi:hypothetical protein
VDPDVSGPCGQTHTDVIEAAFKEARRLRSGAAAFLEAHVEHIQARAARAKDGYVKLGQTVLDELTLLERHFKISTVLRIALPYAAEDLVSVVDLQRFADASYWLRRRFSDVKLSDPYLCQVNCPKGRTSPHRIADAVAGGRKITFYTNCFDPLQPHTKAGIALHEAFHASFSEFDHDTYQTEKGYPGPDGLTNADSYAVFASIVTTGADFRVLDLGTVRGTDK